MFLEVMPIDDGNFAVYVTGSGFLKRRLAEFTSREEAEEWMGRKAASSLESPGIMKPGSGQAIA